MSQASETTVSPGELDPPVDTVDSAEGNTKPSAPKKSQARNWCFTIHKPKVDKVDSLFTTLKASRAVRCVLQLEKCPETGNLHWQGYVEFSTAKMFNGVVRMLTDWGSAPHIEKARGDRDDNYRYCTKPDTREKGPWSFGFPHPVRDPLAEVEMYQWQKDAIELQKTTPDNRKVYWFWEAHGNCGKTALAKHLVMQGDTLYVNGKAADVKCAVAAWCKDGKPLNTVIFGIPRTTTAEYVSYGALEEIKDGMFFSGKYESGMVCINSPHVWVFANFPPDEAKLSADRWNIIHVSKVTEPIDHF